jgi:ectoine hydroxylase-related dioxygenase (phytanoyl-CoA dioxygenase family)
LNTPKSWWHDCDHKIETSNSKDKVFTEKSVDCDFCEHDLSSFTVHSYDFFQIQKSVFSVVKDILFEEVSILSFDLLALRGPPSLTI